MYFTPTKQQSFGSVINVHSHNRRALRFPVLNSSDDFYYQISPFGSMMLRFLLKELMIIILIQEILLITPFPIGVKTKSLMIILQALTFSLILCIL